jgi:prefoldin subunit 5
MEQSFEKSKAVYKSKLPVIEQTLDLMKTLQKKKESDEEVVTHYSLCDTLYSTAQVDTSESKICLWVGASTMVEYDYEEGLELLGNQLSQSHEKINELNEDLEHLRSNSIIVEVNMARLFNHNVKMKKLLSAAAATSSSEGEVESKSG